MILYLDTSSLLKLYVNEQQSDLVHHWTRQVDVLCTSRVAYAEAMAALSRRWRQRDLDDVGFQRIRRAFTGEWQDFAVVNVDEVRAGELAIRHGLRGFDAIHLAAAIEISGSVQGTRFFFSSFDIQLNRAATAERFIVLDQNAAPDALSSQ